MPEELRLTFLRTILPWIAFFTLQAFFDFVVASVATLLITAAVNLYRWQTTKSIEVTILAFFAGLFIGGVILKSPFILTYQAVLAKLMLAMVAAISLIIRKPFTLQYARAQVHNWWWENPHFVRVNYILTCVWGASFLTGALVSLYVIETGSRSWWLKGAAPSILLIFCIVMTRFFPLWYRKHFLEPELAAITDSKQALIDCPPVRSWEELHARFPRKEKS